MPKMRAVQVARSGGPFEIVEREMFSPGAGQIRIKVQARGICHSDSLVKEGHWPGLQYPLVLIGGRRSVKGWYSGTAADSQDTLAFSVLAGVRSMNEVYPLEKAAEAYDRMMSGKARFCVVLTMGT